jgi:hypothetical protein
MAVMSLSDPGLLAAQRCKRLWAKLGNLCASEPTMRNGNVALGTLVSRQAVSWRLPQMLERSSASPYEGPGLLAKKQSPA